MYKKIWSRVIFYLLPVFVFPHPESSRGSRGEGMNILNLSTSQYK